MTKRITTEDDICSEFEGLSLESAILWMQEKKSILDSYNGVALFEFEYNYDSPRQLMLRIERDETPQETASRLVGEKANEQRLQAAAKMAEAREYELFKKLSEKYGVTA